MATLPKKIKVKVYTAPSMIRVPSQDQLQKEFKPYAIELGYLIYSWNRLQSKLSNLFWDVIGTQNGLVARAIWNAITFDRAQRQMLLAGALVAPFNNPRAKDDIKWIIDRAEEFEDKRNNAIHAPLTFVTDETGTTLTSAWYTGHPRAKKLQNAQLLNEFRWYAEAAAVLANFADQVHSCLMKPDVSWPERPQLPLLQQTATRKGKHRRTKSK
jgi:hypothetical protein